jgi:hypothetical protein
MLEDWTYPWSVAIIVSYTQKETEKIVKIIDVLFLLVARLTCNLLFKTVKS